EKPSPRLVILTPSHQFPLGGAMPPQRRIEFLNWAKSNNAWIIEDDYDSEFRYSGRPIPALASLDNADRTLYIGTFSKVFSVSLRLGYLVMPKALIPEFRKTLTRYSVKAALPCQPALASFIDRGELYRHIRRVKRVYSERRKILLDALQQAPDKLRFEDHQAGMQIALKFNQTLDDKKIADEALKHQIILAPLSAYYGSGKPQSGVLIGFCSDLETKIPGNVKTILEIIGRSER
ncbi:MAG: PLP-dependent aminotransferase family protein, partial [Pseudomonadota bacterium]